MSNTRTTFWLIAAFALGTISTSFVSGCQKVEQPVAENDIEEPEIELPAFDLGDVQDVDTDATAPAAPEPETTAPETESADSPAAEPADDTEPAATEPAATEPAATEPADEPADKPADEPAQPEEQPAKEAPAATAAAAADADPDIKAGDWSQWGGTSYRNNVPVGKGIPVSWQVGDFDRKTNAWIKDEAKNIKWVARVGSQTYGNPVISGGHVYVGTNNGAGWLSRYPSNIDLGCLLAFSEADGSFLWQDSSEKLPTGRVHDWPLQGICCAPLVEGERLWYVTSRGEVKCLDTKGYHDGEDDGEKATWARLVDMMKNEDAAKDKVGPIIQGLGEGQLADALREALKGRGQELPAEVKVTAGEGNKWTVTAKIDDADREFRVQLTGAKLSVFRQTTVADLEEADTIWTYDMMSKLGVSQHNMCSCSVTALGDVLFVNTSNGLDESHINLPAPNAPSFIAMDKNTGEVLWTDGSPGRNILHGQWSSPTVANLGGVPQVVFAGGDGWVYSFRADRGNEGKPELLWKFDANPKDSKWILGGRGTRNNIIATPVVYSGAVYVAVGQDPEHGEGNGHLWCIDPTKRGDVSPQLAMKIEDDERVAIEHRRLQAVVEEDGEVAVDNPNSAVIWHYSEFDQNGDDTIDFEEEMHRSCGTVAIKNDLLYIADFSGLFHCLDAKTGKVHWTYDMLAAAWGSPLIVDGHVYIGDEDGDISVFKLSADPKVAMKEVDGEMVPINGDEYGEVTNMNNSVYSTPVVANNVLFIANKTHIFAISPTTEEAAE